MSTLRWLLCVVLAAFMVASALPVLGATVTIDQIDPFLVLPGQEIEIEGPDFFQRNLVSTSVVLLWKQGALDTVHTQVIPESQFLYFRRHIITVKVPNFACSVFDYSDGMTGGGRKYKRLKVRVIQRFPARTKSNWAACRVLEPIGCVTSPPTPPDCSDCDLDGSGKCGSADVVIFDSDWGCFWNPIQMGHATSASNDPPKLTDTSKTWEVNEWAGYVLRVEDDFPNPRTILSNTATTLTVDGPDWPGLQAGNYYQIDDCEIDLRCDIDGDGVCNNTDDDLFYDTFSEPECIE